MATRIYPHKDPVYSTRNDQTTRDDFQAALAELEDIQHVIEKTTTGLRPTFGGFRTVVSNIS